jgi:hypothetical protein
MTSRGFIAFAVCLTAMCSPGYGQIHVGQYNQNYHEYDDYMIYGSSEITILHPSLYGAYEFDCYDESTGNPEVIERLSASSDLGALEVKISAHDGRQYGASDVWVIQIHQTSGGGRLVELKISGNYGEVEHGDTLLADSAGTLSIGTPAIGTVGAAHGDVIKPVDIRGDVDSFTVQGAVRPEGTVTIDGDLSALSIATPSGESPQITQIEQMQTSAHANLRNLRNLWMSAFPRSC